MEFKSHITDLKIIITLILISGIGLILSIEAEIIKTNISLTFIALIVIILISALYIYYAKMNHDFIINENDLLIINRFPFFKKREKIELNKIKSISFKDDSFFNLFSGYKWVKIEYLSDFNSLKTIKRHCNGMEYDAFDENINFPTFDQFFDELKLRELNVKWIKN